MPDNGQHSGFVLGENDSEAFGCMDRQLIDTWMLSQVI